MKQNLLTLLVILSSFCYHQTSAQVTLLSNNTNLATGFVLNDKALLISKEDSLWVTNGSAAGTVQLTNAVSYVDSGGGFILGGKYFFSGKNAANGIELWATDGTSNGTTFLKDINPGTANSTPSDFFLYNNTLFFTANDGTNGRELWISNGTAAGTMMLKDINAGAASSFTLTTGNPDFHITNGILYFVANNGINGNELWRTDGTAAGTTIVKDITTTPAISSSTQFGQFINFGTTQIFGITSGSFLTSSFQLWKSDGTAAGTTLIKDFGPLSGIFPSFFFPFNGKIYFNGTDYTNTGNELWVTDGTTAGTTLVKDIYPGGVDASSLPLLFNAVVINNKFYFQATTAANGTELWYSDGTEAGTQLLKEINPGDASADPIVFKNYDFASGNIYASPLFNGKFFFSADDGTNGKELWVTDGSAQGTTMVKNIGTGALSGVADSLFSYFYTTSGLYFSANDGSGLEPWLSNGTDAGTTKVFDVNPGAAGSNPVYLFVLNNQLFFSGTNGDNPTKTDLFKIDGRVIVLPITLLNFSASVQPSNAVSLNWQTTNEKNSNHFIIERSVDGNKFTEIGRVNATGNNTLNQNYGYTDQQAATLNTTLLYYRLSLVDKDGTSQTSKVLMVHIKGSQIQFTFSPNPAQQQLNVMVEPGGAKNVALRIVDANGKQVYQQSLKDGVSAYQQNINVRGLQKGVYFLQLITGNTVKSEKFIKQ
jgi:ELWxxDGT repeat protein